MPAGRPKGSRNRVVRDRCRRGHAYVDPYIAASGYRHCRECRRRPGTQANRMVAEWGEVQGPPLPRNTREMAHAAWINKLKERMVELGVS